MPAMIVLHDGTTGITLNPDLFWTDENDWHPVEQTTERTITGALVVQASSRINGRPITLEPEDENSGWMNRTTINALRNWAAVPGKVMTLTIHDTDRTVMFRHQDGEGVSARPVVHYSDVVAGDYYRCTLRFMEVTP